jgi:hypothetical protein
MATIVISYRRDDSKWITGRIFDRLEDHYGHGQVFMDIDNIPIGMDFRRHLQRTLARCDILIAVIGPDWVAPDQTGRSRLLDETDWVRVEIETALAKGVPVVPLLVDDAQMPQPAQLPGELRDFAFRQAARVDTGVDFRAHMQRLIGSLDRLLKQENDNGDSGEKTFVEADVASATRVNAESAPPPVPDASEKKLSHAASWLRGIGLVLFLAAIAYIALVGANGPLMPLALPGFGVAVVGLLILLAGSL